MLKDQLRAFALKSWETIQIDYLSAMNHTPIQNDTNTKKRYPVQNFIS